MSFDADTALTTLPSPAQVGAYCFFPASFLVGPQFSFSLYRRWLDSPLFLGKNVTDWDETYKGQQRYMVRCVLLAILYLGLQQLIGAAFPSSALLSSDYQQLPFLQRCWYFLVTGKFVYNKYIGIWLLTEGKKKKKKGPRNHYPFLTFSHYGKKVPVSCLVLLTTVKTTKAEPSLVDWPTRCH
jgi:lysophospholipid acyltransferase 5